MELWIAFSLGLLGSLHCVGMCGPIALALPLTAQEKGKVIVQSLLYNGGRILTYSLLGLFMGLMGWGIVLAGYQKIFSIALGIALILSALFSLSFERQLMKNDWFRKSYERLKTRLSQLLSLRTTSSAFKIGLLNGILPCGLVYVALAGAVACGHALNGAAYMAAFGLGTIPLMLGMMLFGNFYRATFLKLRRWIPLGLVVFGLLFIYRGIMLEVPLDLEFWESTNFQIRCH